MRERLQAWLSDEVGEPVVIGELQRTSAGFSRENWVFDATWGGERRDLIARRDPVGSVLETDRRVETAVLRAMGATAVPSPTLRWVDLSGARLDRAADHPAGDRVPNCFKIRHSAPRLTAITLCRAAAAC